jgi:hypothetical protein
MFMPGYSFLLLAQFFQLILQAQLNFLGYNPLLAGEMI